MFYKTDAPCDLSVHLDDEIFSRLLVKLPESLEYGSQEFHLHFPAIEVGGITWHGLSKLRKFGPAIPYCANGRRMVQVDIYSDDFIFFSAPWKACTGDQGHIMLRSNFLRFTAQFSIVESSEEGVKLEFERALPVETQGLRVAIDGAGRGVSIISEVLSALLTAVLEEAWNEQVSLVLSKAFPIALE
ncbi:hypothetical protein HPB49_015857 [Dermacentor silvarum]|uniref:Uncharacterized protein n=1 Tax=Dermacentor silvarum TaxID=543639 RepID=A0ACB8CFX2_DERSI|nr:hypothetical protein HPB49_015857 [Dermacentor silvarum]